MLMKDKRNSAQACTREEKRTLLVKCLVSLCIHAAASDIYDQSVLFIFGLVTDWPHLWFSCFSASLSDRLFSIKLFFSIHISCFEEMNHYLLTQSFFQVYIVKTLNYF